MNDFSHLRSSLPDEPSRPVQHGALARLPVELLIQIFNYLCDSGDSGRALAISCCAVRLAVSQDLYRRNGKAVLLKCLQTADLDILERCKKYGVVSVDYSWEVPKCRPNYNSYDARTPYPATIWPTGRPGISYYRPIDCLLVSAFAGDSVEQKHYNILEWLVDSGHDASSKNEETPGKHMVRLLPSQLQRVRDRKSMNIISDMIHLLSRRGFPTPCTKFALDILPKDEWDPVPNYLMSSGDCHGKNPDRNEVRGSLVSLSMRAHCPPSVLKVVLEDYRSRGVNLETGYLDPPVGLDEYDDNMRVKDPPFELKKEGIETWIPTVWWHTCRMEDLLGMLHCDRFGVRGWEEAYPGEVDDIFAAKIHLLSTYKAITKQEESLLELVLKAMRDITDLQKKGSLSGLDLQKASWETLWLAVSPFYERCEIGLFDLESKTGREFHVKKRLHRFAFKSSQPYNPWRAWFTQAKLQKRWEAWEPRSARAMELALWNDEEWKSIWRILRWNEAINVDEEGNAKVRWCQMGLDVWVDTVKRDYLRRVPCPEFDLDLAYRAWPGFFLHGDLVGCP